MPHICLLNTILFFLSTIFTLLYSTIIHFVCTDPSALGDRSIENP